MRVINNILVLLGVIVSLGVSIYAAQPWGDNYAYQTVDGYPILALLELWILFPFLIFYFLNNTYHQSARHMRLMFGVCMLGSIGVAAAYLKFVLFSGGSTAALIFLFFPGYQLGFAVIVWVCCIVMGRYTK